MKKFSPSKILIPVDFSKTSLKAIKHGAFIAKLNKGELILLNVQKKTDLLDVIFPAFKLKDFSVITDYLNSKLQTLAADVKKEFGIKVTTLVSLGNITSEIVSVAEENEVNLIVMGTHGGDSQSSLMLGSNAYRVIAKTKCPVVTIRANTTILGYKNIVMPIDTTPHTRQKVLATLEFAEKFAAKIHLLGILEKSEKNEKPKMEFVLKQIQDTAKKLKLVTSSTIVESDDASNKIIKFAAKHKADLISIMSDQQGGASKLLGQFSHHIIHDSKTPVMTFKPVINESSDLGGFGGLW